MTLEEKILFGYATDRYRAAGRYALHFARGKLKHDPAFFAILRERMIPDDAKLLDLGCGQGLLLSTLIAARQCHEIGVWPGDWPAPPTGLQLHGIELLPRDVRRARRALGELAILEGGDIRDTPFPKSDVVVILDVLHYVARQEQEEVLLRVAECLGDSGRLLLRVADTQAGARSVFTYLGDRVGTLLRGELWPRHTHRPISEWSTLLEQRGFSVSTHPMSQGTPFSNVLLIADRS
jgi:cyclopropane fatty-acyl-phospholipid synthase-like methyltransferase